MDLTVARDQGDLRERQARRVLQEIWDLLGLLDFLENLPAMMLVPCPP